MSPGKQLLAQIEAEQASDSAAVNDIIAALARAMPEDVRQLLRSNGGDATELLLAVMETGDPTAAIHRLSTQNPEKTALYAKLGMRLFPLQSYRLYRELEQRGGIDREALHAAAGEISLDTRLLELSGLANRDGVLVVPLFHSASVTLFGQRADSQIRTEYRRKGGAWAHAHTLQWDPVTDALSGSIARLSPGTDYEVRAIISRNGQRIGTAHATFRTWDEQPPVDPQRVYRLRDIYKGGTLDLNALNIRGQPNGWAKIIGDAETPIIAAEGASEAIRIGRNSYVLFENITVRGGRHAITADSAHHLRFSGCDVSGWGREPAVIRDGLGYDSEESTQPINLDAAFALLRSGVVVVEKCRVHSPRGRANHWGHGHPRGPTAFLADANHPEPAFQGQMVIRNNRFHGAPDHRLNDVIESRFNGRVWGGFMRDSAIHDNYLAYANDDIIEIDGGQSNVLVYNNEMEQGFCGISATPNMRGPSYIFNNFIHNLGDERQTSWAAIKLGGLYSAPAGVVNLFENLIETGRNGITYAGFRGDSTFWVEARNNVIVSSGAGESAGYAIFDIAGYRRSQFSNNHFYHVGEGEARVSGPIDTRAQVFGAFPSTPAAAHGLAAGRLEIRARDAHLIKNFSVQDSSGKVVVGIAQPLPGE